MKHSTSAPTKAEQARFRILREMGCIACAMNGNTWDSVEPEIHHFLSGNKRIGHHATIPLCHWHHQGIAYDGVPSAWFLDKLGPSFHKHTREFRIRYGDDAVLLARVNAMIDNNGETP